MYLKKNNLDGKHYRLLPCIFYMLQNGTLEQMYLDFSE
jgi:hypothetical protein